VAETLSDQYPVPVKRIGLADTGEREQMQPPTIRISVERRCAIRRVLD
jgi:hypothetical protein